MEEDDESDVASGLRSLWGGDTDLLPTRGLSGMKGR